jgi:hypothetical protein
MKHSQNTTVLQSNVYFELECTGYWSQVKVTFRFLQRKQCQGQLQTSQSLSVAAVCLHCLWDVRLDGWMVA